MTSAASASPVPGAFVASASALARSFRISNYPTGLSAHALIAQIIERRERQVFETVDHQLRSLQLVGRIAIGDRYASKSGAARRIQAPARVLDGHRAARIEGPPGALAQPVEGQHVGSWRRLALWRVSSRDDGGEQDGEAGRLHDFSDLMPQRPGRNGDRNGGRGGLDEFACAGKEDGVGP